ncbi:MAG: PQQ-dependent dehydrogenase, methanol/ethanol family [Caulobacterales bacterium]
MRKSGLAILAALAAIIAAACQPLGQKGPAAVDEARIVAADSEPGNWMSHGRTYSEQRFSPLESVNLQNVSQLGLAWSYELSTGRAASGTPIVVDGVMYVTSAWSILYALNAETGEELWVYDPEVPHERGQYACCDVSNRGVAVWNGKVYVGTIDGRLVAVDAKTGQEAWDIITVDQSRPYTITGAPRAAAGLIFIGNAGAEYGVRGYVSAYDAETGALRWRFYTTPNPNGPDEAASDSVRETALATWNPQGAWLESGGGGTVWDAIVYDPEQNALWVGVGNGSPWNQQIRAPDRPDANDDNLYLSSIVKVDAETGAYQCHYQTTPGDTWDYTATQPIMLADLQIEGRQRQVVMQAPKNGFFYVLDRADCALVSATPLIPMGPPAANAPPGTPITWSTGQVDANGRPIENPGARYAQGTTLVAPSAFGTHNWHPMAMSPQTGLVYIPIQDSIMDYTTDPAFQYRPGRFNTGTVHGALPDDPNIRNAAKNSLTGSLIAWDPVNRREAWRRPLTGAWNGGALATAGGLVFQGTVDGYIKAYNAATGEELWSFDNQAATLAGPISYAVDGQQYIATLAGYGSVYFLNAGFAAPREGNSLNGRVNVFRVGGTASLPPLNLERLPVPEPPTLRVSAATMALGMNAFNAHCAVCHGAGAVTGGVLPDVRRSTSLASAEDWRATLYGGRTALGMPNFQQWLTPAEVEAIRAYVARQARPLYEQERARTTP